MEGILSDFHSLVIDSLAANNMCVVTCLAIGGTESIERLRTARSGVGAMCWFEMSENLEDSPPIRCERIAIPHYVK